MQNVKMHRENNLLIITVDMAQKQGPSKSGKSMVIATTEGNKAVPGDDTDAKIGLNIYEPRD